MRGNGALFVCKWLIIPAGIVASAWWTRPGGTIGVSPSTSFGPR